MVTVQQAEQKLAQRRQTLEQAKQEVQQFQPRVKMTQAQLRKATPQSQLRVKAQQQAREQAKREAIQQVEQEFKKQQQLEKQFAPVKAAFEAQQREQREWELARKYAVKGRVPLGETKSIRKKYRQLVSDRSIPEPTITATPTELELGMSLPAEIRRLRPEEVTKGVSLPAMTFAPDVEAQAVPDLREQIERISIPSFEIPETTQKSPFTTKGFVPVTTPDQRVTVGAPRQEFAPKIEPFQLTARRIADVALTGLGSATVATAKKAGVPTITKPIEFKERRFFERGTQEFDPVTQQFIIPEPQQLGVEFPTAQEQIQRRSLPGVREQVVISPERIGGVTRLGGELALLAYPATGIPILAEEAQLGIQQAKQEVPTVEQVIKEQTQELSAKERSEFLQTPQGKQYKEDVEGYVKALETQRKAGIGRTALAVTGIAAPTAFVGVRRGVRAARTPFEVEVIGQPTSFFGATATATGDVTRGIARRITVTPRAEAQIPRAKVILGQITTGKVKVPESAFKITREVDVGVEPFIIAGEKAEAVAATRRLGKRTTLTKLEQVRELQKPLEVMDFSKLPKEFRFISKQLPVRAADQLTTFVGMGQTVKGIGKGAAPKISVGKDLVADIPVRLERFSKGQQQFFLPTQPAKTEFVKSITRVQPSGALPTGERIFLVEAAAKTTKKPKGIAKGKVQTETGVVFIREAPGPTDVTFIGKGTEQLTQKQQQQLAARIASLAPPKKPRLPKKKAPTKAQQELALTPVERGEVRAGFVRTRLGEPTLDLAERPIVLDVQPQPQPQPLAVSVRQQDFVTPTITDRVAFVPLSAAVVSERIAPREVEVLQQVPREALVPRVAQIPVVAQAARPREVTREAVIPRVRVATRQRVVQRPAVTPTPIPTTRTRPRPAPRPIVKPRRIIIPDLDDEKRRELLERLRQRELFLPFVRRRGVFEVVGRPAPLEAARRRGLKVVRGTLAASLQVRRAKTGQPIPFSGNGREFRLGSSGKDPFTIVQKAPARLGRRTEVAEIISSRRAGNVRFL